MLFKILLDDEAAHRMANQDWRRGQGRCDAGQVGDVVMDSVTPQAAAALASSVSTEADRVGGVSVGRKVTEKVFIPAPCGVPSSMHEENRRRPASDRR